MRVWTLLAFLTVARVAIAGSRLPAERLIWNIPEALPLIRAANEVYVFPVTFSEKRHRPAIDGTLTPQGDYKRVRLLGSAACRKLCRLLGKENNWFHGSDHLIAIGAEPRSVGYIFRRGKDKLVLLGYMGWRFEGTFNNEPTYGSLEVKPSDRLDEWKKHYAKPELWIK